MSIISSSGSDPDENRETGRRATRAEPGDHPQRHPLVRAASWLLSQSAAVLLGVVIATLAAGTGLALLGAKSDPRGLNAQLDALRTELDKQRFSLDFLERRRLRPEVESVVLGVRREQLYELRIYDFENGKLRRSFRFSPVSERPRAGERPLGSPSDFVLARYVDLDNDQDREVVGSFRIGEEGKGELALRLPVAISWRARERRWEVDPLLRSPTTVRATPKARPVGDLVATRRLYGLRDRKSNLHIAGYGMTSVAVGAPRQRQLLVGAARVDLGSVKDASVELWLGVWSVRRSETGLVADRCEDTDRVGSLSMRTPVAADDDYRPALDRAYGNLLEQFVSYSCSEESSRPRDP